MKFDVSERIRTTASADEVLQFLAERFTKISVSTKISNSHIIVRNIEASFGSINRADRTLVTVQKTEGGWFITGEVDYRTSGYFWLFFLIGLFTWIGWIFPIGFFLYQRNTVKSAIQDCFSHSRNYFDSPVNFGSQMNTLPISSNFSPQKFHVSTSNLSHIRKSKWFLVENSGVRLLLPDYPATFTVGRNSSNLTISDSSVSASHAVISVTESGLSLSDLNSTNGTTINKNKIVPNQFFMLKDGDRVIFGAKEFVVQAEI